ncbi:MAG: alpha/beta hydrolase [Nanoarchaeota archaeon]
MNCIIIHRCPSNKEKAMDSTHRTYDKHWIPWTKEELENNGFKVETPLMPEPWDVDYDAWKRKFDILNVNEESVLVGHSCGCSFLVRWLGDTKKKVKKLVLVAPWKIPYGVGRDYENKKKFYGYEIDRSIRDRTKEIIIFTSDNEAPDGKQSVIIFHEALGGKVIELRQHGHYTLDGMGTEEFPELLETILR